MADSPEGLCHLRSDVVARGNTEGCALGLVALDSLEGLCHLAVELVAHGFSPV